MKTSQTQQIYNYLKEGNSISPIEALEKFGCFRLSARIYELRKGEYDGIAHDISEVPHEGKQFAVYRLSPPVARDLFGNKVS